jgi:hypothetical protein
METGAPRSAQFDLQHKQPFGQGILVLPSRSWMNKKYDAHRVKILHGKG